MTDQALRYRRPPGVRVEPVATAWVAWSPASGETLVLNDESAAVLELLAEHDSVTSDEAAELLHAETGIDLAQLQGGLALSWIALERAGLVRRDEHGMP